MNSFNCFFLLSYFQKAYRCDIGVLFSCQIFHWNKYQTVVYLYIADILSLQKNEYGSNKGDIGKMDGGAEASLSFGQASIDGS